MIHKFLPHTRRPDITFHETGRIDITANLSRTLSLEENDVIDVVYDDVAREFYIYVRHRASSIVGRHEAQCRVTNRRARKTNNFRAHSKTICQGLFNYTKPLTPGPLRCQVGYPLDHPQLGWAVPIIIRRV